MNIFSDLFTAISQFFLFFSIIFSLWWVWLPVILWLILKTLYGDYATGIFLAKNWNFDLLEIVLEKGEEKTPKSMEKVITTLHGGRTGYSWWDKNIKGAKQDMFSLEIVGINGEIHFLIRTLKKYRRLVENAVYGSFPEVEITEVKDYVLNLDREKLEIDYDIFGGDFGMAKKDAYPIRTYMSHSGSEDDPLSQILEVLANLESGEQLWIQLPIEPADDDWIDNSKKELEKLLGKRVDDKRGFVDKYLMPLIEAISFGLIKAPVAPSTPEQKFGIAQDLTPGKAEAIKAIENNITKSGFKTVMRVIYIAPKEIFNSASIKTIFGALKQFNDASLNSFRLDDKTVPSVENFFGKADKSSERLRKNLLLDNYIGRKIKSTKFVFNTEELATVFHFPNGTITTSTLKRVRSKKATPPSELPLIN